MRIAVISDIHGNLEAFESVLEDMVCQHVDKIVSLGDNIGYGADSEAIVHLLKDHKVISVLGNHEWACVNEKVYNWYIKDVKKSLDITMAGLSSASFDYLRKLKLHLSENNAWFVHGFPPDSVRHYLHQMQTADLIRAIDQLTGGLCFVGHTHKLGLVYKSADDIRTRRLQAGVIKLDKTKKYLVNAGSVGQPRDGDFHAKYLIWEPSSSTIDVRSIVYDNHKAARKIIDAGMPLKYAHAVDKTV